MADVEVGDDPSVWNPARAKARGSEEPHPRCLVRNEGRGSEDGGLLKRMIEFLTSQFGVSIVLALVVIGVLNGAVAYCIYFECSRGQRLTRRSPRTRN